MSGNYNSGRTEFTYPVRSGDTAYDIARRKGMTYKQLKALNPDKDLDNIKPGQSIRLRAQVSNPQTQIPKSSVFTSGSAQLKTQPKKSQTPAPVLFQKNANKKATLIAQPKKTTVPIQPSKTFLHSTPAKTALPAQKGNIPQKPQTQTDGILTLEKFEQGLSDETKLLTPFLKKKEGKVANVYIEPNGKAAIGYGHFLLDKPQFLLDIEKQKLSPKEKNILLKAALAKKENQISMKQKLQAVLLDAIKTTGIKNVPSTVDSNLLLTNSQIELLLYSDMKKAQNAMEKTFGKDILSERTAKQKSVALDLFFNVGKQLPSKAPEFVKQFKAGNMEAAQAELNIFKTNGKVALGLIKRNYHRMLLLNDNKLSPLAKERLLAAYNEYMKEHNKSLAKNFAIAEENLKRA